MSRERKRPPAPEDPEAGGGARDPAAAGPDAEARSDAAAGPDAEAGQDAGAGLDAEAVIAALGLQPLAPEGGYFAETYRARDVLPSGFAGHDAAHALATAIYYLITPERPSTLHRLCADEIYHFYLGDPVEMLLLFPDRSGEVRLLGTDLAGGMRPQIVVPRGTWHGSRLLAGGRFALLGTTMAPGFDPTDFEPADAAALAAAYPEHRERILALGRR